MSQFRLSVLDWVCFALILIGALNWGFVGLLNINVVEGLLEPVFQSSAANFLASAIYVVIGLAGLYLFYLLYRITHWIQS